MPSMNFEPHDSVRVTRLLFPSRDVDGASAIPPQPRIGEQATVVDALGEDLYLVERATDDGRTLWMAEFHGAELELLRRAESL
jgi:hypothetical protein